jgi:hypothetical protein
MGFGRDIEPIAGHNQNSVSNSLALTSAKISLSSRDQVAPYKQYQSHYI